MVHSPALQAQAIEQSTGVPQAPKNRQPMRFALTAFFMLHQALSGFIRL
jgi:hypothetical protein